MAIDHTFMVNRAKAFIGSAVTGKIDLSDSDLLKCLGEVTLPTFSIYVPWFENVEIDVARDQLPGHPGIYAMRTNADIIGVDRLMEAADDFGAFPYTPMLTGDALDRQLVADRRSLVSVSLTFEFRAPNIVEVFPKGLTYQTFTLRAKLVHPLHLRTVPPGSREILTDLYLADLSSDILGIRQYFQSIQSVFGEVNLRTDRLETQASKRVEIIALLQNSILKNGGRRMWIA